MYNFKSLLTILLLVPHYVVAQETPSTLITTTTSVKPSSVPSVTDPVLSTSTSELSTAATSTSESAAGTTDETTPTAPPTVPDTFSTLDAMDDVETIEITGSPITSEVPEGTIAPESTSDVVVPSETNEVVSASTTTSETQSTTETPSIPAMLPNIKEANVINDVTSTTSSSSTVASSTTTMSEVGQITSTQPSPAITARTTTTMTYTQTTLITVSPLKSMAALAVVPDSEKVGETTTSTPDVEEHVTETQPFLDIEENLRKLRTGGLAVINKHKINLIKPENTRESIRNKLRRRGSHSLLYEIGQKRANRSRDKKRM